MRLTWTAEACGLPRPRHEMRDRHFGPPCGPTSRRGRPLSFAFLVGPLYRCARRCERSCCLHGRMATMSRRLPPNEERHRVAGNIDLRPDRYGAQVRRADRGQPHQRVFAVVGRVLGRSGRETAVHLPPSATICRCLGTFQLRAARWHAGNASKPADAEPNPAAERADARRRHLTAVGPAARPPPPVTDRLARSSAFGAFGSAAARSA